MSLFFYIFLVLIGLLLLLFTWSIRKPGRHATRDSDACVLDGCERKHVTYMAQIRQALGEADYEFLLQRAPKALQRRVSQERRRVALTYLSALRGDFQSMLRMAKIIALLSPEVAAVDEFQRLRLAAGFGWRYQMIRLQLRAGLAPIPRLSGLSDLVSGLSVRMEMAMKELGERAALAAEMASSFDRGGTDVV